MACLSSQKDRHSCFYVYLKDIMNKSKNKLLITNILTLDLRIQLESFPLEYEQHMDLCRDIAMRFEEIGCPMGEALIYYIHGTLERKQEESEKHRFGDGLMETVELLNLRLKRCIPEAKD